MPERTFSLKTHRKLSADARAAQRMIREVVEQNAPAGQNVEPGFVREAEALITGIPAIVRAQIAGATPARTWPQPVWTS